MKTISANNEILTWTGAVSLEHGGEGVMPWRLPCKYLDFFPCQSLHMKAAAPSGVRLRFATDSKNICFHTAPQQTENANYDLYTDGTFFKTVSAIANTVSIKFENMPRDIKTLELWLHQATPFKLKGISIDEGSSVERSEDNRPRWITYGSSITHCVSAESPSFTWPGVVSRAKGLNLTSLGFGGDCHADPMLARMIRDMPANIISIKIGINIHGQSSLNIRSFQPAILGTIATIRDNHPGIPLIICSPIWCEAREKKPNAAGMTLEMMREETVKAVEAFRRHGDKNIYYVDGLKLFGPDLAADHLPDQLHPDAEGYKILGRNFLREVFEVHKVQIPEK